MDDYHAEKPSLIEKKGKSRIDVTIFSMVLFVGSFFWFFQESIWFILALLGVLVIHELGHFAFMKKFKYKNVRMLFVPFMGAFVQGHKEKYSQKESFIVVLAGPIPGLILGLICFYIAMSTQSAALLTLSFLFILLNEVNLLPLDPLDGGQLFRLLVRKNEDLFQLIFSLISSITLIGIGYLIDSWILMGFGFLMSFRVRNLQKSLVIRKEMTAENLNFRIPYSELTNADYAKIRRYVIENNRTLRKYLELNDGDNETETLIAKEVKAVLAPALTFDTSRLGKVFVTFLWLGALVGPILFFIFNDFDMNWYYEAFKNWG
jgi:Zn-dependent protease